MAFQYLLVLSSVCIGATLAGDCMSTNPNGPRCLTKDEVGGLSIYVIGGDPCFLNSGKRWCFSDTDGNMVPCACTPECGCQDAADVVPPPKCDNSAVPNDLGCDKEKYCAKAVYGKKNTLCKYCKVSKKCKKVCQYGLTDEEKKQIVDKHNELRRRVAKGEETINGQPQAANMNELIWDDDLALSAQRWADQCKSGHDKNRNLPKFKFVGQNFAMTGAGQSLADNDVGKFVQMWYDEVKDFKPSSISPFTTSGENTGVVGHYTQVVWAETKYVGCGFVHFNKKKSFTKHLICNYGIGGNLIGSEMYAVGEPGSKCPADTNDGLCA